jgi:hypothetical protein
LAEMEPAQLVGAAPAPTRTLRGKAPETPPAAPEAAGPPPGTPPWKWQPKKQ